MSQLTLLLVVFYGGVVNKCWGCVEQVLVVGVDRVLQLLTSVGCASFLV